MKIKFIKIDEKEMGKSIDGYRAYFKNPPKYIVMNENTFYFVKEMIQINLFCNDPKNKNYNATFWGIPIAICNSGDLKDGEVELV
jgi:hypothetical protein